MWHGGHVLTHPRQRALSLALSRPPRKPLLCLVTRLLASSLSLISLIIVSCDAVRIVAVGKCYFDALFVSLCIKVRRRSGRRSRRCVWFMRRVHVSATFVCVCLQFLICIMGGSGFIWVHHALHSYGMQYVRVQQKEAGPRLWFNTHTPMDQGLGECMCWWKSNVLCLQGTAWFSPSLLRLLNLVSHANVGLLWLKTAPQTAFLSVCLCLFSLYLWGSGVLRIWL